MAFKFETLKIWQEAVGLANETYRFAKKLPRNEEFGLASQLQRASVSVSLNIAEGSSRKSEADNSRFLQMAIGSLYEVVTILVICREQKFLTKDEFDDLYHKCEDLSRMLHGYKNYLKE